VLACNKPKYSTPVKNLRAAAAVAKELPALSGEALREQHVRLNDLLSEANAQLEAYKKANPGVGALQYVVSAGGAGARSRGQAASPHHVGCMLRVSPLATGISSSKSMIRQLPKSKWRVMLAKVADMTTIRMPTKTIRPGREHARLVMADITTCPGIRHKSNLSNIKVSDTRCSNKVKASRDIERMMAILPSRGRDISNPNSSSSRTCFRSQLPRGWDPNLWRQMMRASSWTRYT
jgi:hypothetical protein